MYLLQSTSARRSYVGIAVDVDRRLRQHNGELVGGARSTRSGRPWTIARRLGPFADRSTASRVEYAWKQVRGRQRRGRRASHQRGAKSLSQAIRTLTLTLP